jgi:hypothetical protein
MIYGCARVSTDGQSVEPIGDMSPTRRSRIREASFIVLVFLTVFRL